MERKRNNRLYGPKQKRNVSVLYEQCLVDLYGSPSWTSTKGHSKEDPLHPRADVGGRIPGVASPEFRVKGSR